jgi:predicted P-loop ATPase
MQSFEEFASGNYDAVAGVRAYITRTEEKFRPAYGRNEVVYQRRCVFVGTTNRTDYLRDETGNWRFWPIKIDSVGVEAIRKDRDQIWAAAKALYDSGEQWWLTDDEASLARTQQERRTVVDPLYEEVAQWLDDTNTEQACMRAIMDNVVSSDGEQSSAQITPQLQHRIRGALNAAGYESIGRKFTSGDYKGMTIFTRMSQPQ